MSLITQCPACATLFKVVPDQLRISEGWVRCGQCDEVFDANAQMVREESQAASHEASSSSNEFHAPVADMDDSGVEPEMGLLTEDDLRSRSPDALGASSAVEDFLVPVDECVPAPADEPLIPPVPFEEDRIEPHLERLLADSPIAFKPLRNPEETQAVPLRARGLALLFGTLLVILCLQWLVHERDRLAAKDAGLRPILHAICSVLGCQIESMRQIDAILIDSSSFVKVRNDIYRLNFVLKSSAQVPLAVPAMELTLTDAQDQPLLRKVIFASEFGAQGPVLASGGDVVVSIALSVKAAAPSDRVAGYRLLAFYP